MDDNALGVSRQIVWDIIEYEPHKGNTPEGSQANYHLAEERFKVSASGRRWGKSKSGSMEYVDKLFIPKCRGWIVSETYSVGEEEFTYLEDAVELLLRYFKIPLRTIKKAHNTRTGELFMHFPWGAKVEVKSAKYPTTLVGKGLGWCIMAEAAKMGRFVFERYIQAALSDFRAPCSFISTPEGDNWFKEYHDKGADGSVLRLENGAVWEDSWHSWNFPSWENPILFPLGFKDPEIQRQMGTPEGTPWFWQEVGARFSVFVGQIYPQFREDIHVLKVAA